MKALKLMVIVVITITTASCVSVTPRSVKTMSTSLLCEMIGPTWIGSSSDRDTIYEELERRGARCDHDDLMGPLFKSYP
jgi:hypothetical protein